jgi:hypothetical protein
LCSSVLCRLWTISIFYVWQVFCTYFVKTMVWSPIPGTGLHRLINEGWLVKNVSSIFCPFVGKSTVCSNPNTYRRPAKRKIYLWFKVETEQMNTTANTLAGKFISENHASNPINSLWFNFCKLYVYDVKAF